MIHIFKNLNFGGLLALVAGVVLMVSWTVIEKTSTNPTWYQVSVIDISEPHDEASNLRIDGEYPGGTPTFPCDEEVGTPCAVLLDGELDEDNMPSTVAEANTDGFPTLETKRTQQ